MNKRKFCSQCGGQVRYSAKFCNHCGARLRQRLSVSSAENNIQHKKIAAVLKPTETREVITLRKEAEPPDTRLSHLEQQLHNLQTEIQIVEQEYYHCRQIRIMEQSEVDELKKLSWNSFSARLKGNLQEKLETEEIDVVRATTKEQLVLVQLQELRSAEEELKENLERLRKKPIPLKKGMGQHQTALERETQTFDLPTLEDDLEDLTSGKEFLHRAHIDLGKAIDQLKSTTTASTANMLGEVSVFDMMERDRISNAQHHISSADANIRQARLQLDSVQVPTARIEMPPLVLDKFLDGLFGDFLSHQKIKEGLRRCEESLDRVLSVMNQVDQSINHLGKRITKMGEESEVSEQLLAPQSSKAEPMIKVNDFSVQMPQEDLKIAKIEIDTPSTTEITEIASMPDNESREFATGLQQPLENHRQVEKLDISEKNAHESLKPTITSGVLSQSFLEELQRLRYRFKSLNITKTNEKAESTFFSDKPQAMSWAKDKDKKFIVESAGRISANWNANINFQLTVLEKFNWKNPYDGVNVSSEEPRVVQGILKTSRIAEKLRSNILLAEVHIEISDRQISMRLKFRDVPDVRDSIDLARDLTLALELVRW
ncbi:MAG: hypothetical protein ACE5OZ_07595 [Candidatus Heimdallarchaeota archaeon]